MCPNDVVPLPIDSPWAIDGTCRCAQQFRAPKPANSDAPAGRVRVSFGDTVDPGVVVEPARG